MTPKTKTTLTVLLAPAIYALIIRLLFGASDRNFPFAIMTVSFFVLAPFGIGILTIAASDIRQVKKIHYRLFMPWIPIGILLLITIIFAIEGWACWLMILPLYLIAASAGGFLAGYIRLRKQNKKQILQINITLLILPLLVSPLEKLIPDTAHRYTVNTTIDINAPRATIWSNIVRVRTISPNEDHGILTNLLGFPRPIRAELDYTGVGGSRQAIFSKGLVFREQVTSYNEGLAMSFSIHANPHDIPSTTMDEHVVIGGDYFDVLDGTYELEQLDKDNFRIHLYSHFTLRTTINWYASIWGRLIMKDIQDNILRVIKQRSEQESMEPHSQPARLPAAPAAGS